MKRGMLDGSGEIGAKVAQLHNRGVTAEVVSVLKAKHSEEVARLGYPLELPQATPGLRQVDGPHPPNIFRYAEKMTNLQPTAWKLLDYLWTHRVTEIQDAEEAVWGHDGVNSDNAIKSALKRINQALLEAGCPFRACIKGAYVHFD